MQFDPTALRYVSSANGDYLPPGAFFGKPVVEGNLVKLNAASLAGEANGNGHTCYTHISGRRCEGISFSVIRSSLER